MEKFIFCTVHLSKWWDTFVPLPEKLQKGATVVD